MSFFVHKKYVFIALWVSLFVLSGCGSSGSTTTATTTAPAPQPGVTVSLSVQADTVTEGGTLTLTVQSSEGASVSISCDNGASVTNNMFTAPDVDADTQVTCTATATSGTASATDSVVINVTDLALVSPVAAALGIGPVPAAAPQAFQEAYNRFTRIQAPNGMDIDIFAQDQVGEEQIIRARNVLAFYLENLPLSEFGFNKVLVANQMALNNATLILLNGSDNGQNAPTAGQPLFQSDIVVEGSPDYLNNTAADNTFTAVLRLMHDAGFGVDGTLNTQPGVASLAPYQSMIRAAMENAISSGIDGIPSGAAQLNLWGNNERETLNAFAAENSLTQEYLAAIINVFYGFEGAIAPQREDLYVPRNRAEIEAMDPMGWALVGGDNPRLYFNDMVTFMARIDSGFTGTFLMSLDEQQAYTLKSQFLQNAQLTGSENSNLTGNADNNRLAGNAGDNILDGGEGEDVAVFQGNFSDYNISINNGEIRIIDSNTDRDGAATLRNIEILSFADTIAFNDIDEVTPEMDQLFDILQQPITAQELVDNLDEGGDIALQLNFRGLINLPDNSTRTWTEQERAPFVAGANRWLEVLQSAGSVSDYRLEININVTNLGETANGIASPMLTDMYLDGGNIFPSQGMFSVNSCLFLEVNNAACPEPLTGTAREEEFDANIRHEIGHIMGIGSLWNLDMGATPQDFLPALEGEGNFRNYAVNSSAAQGLIYRQPMGVAAYNQFTQSSFDFAPLSIGHLYSEDQNSPPNMVRIFEGTPIPSLDTELMASDNNYTPVLFGFLQDLGWVIGSMPGPNEP